MLLKNRRNFFLIVISLLLFVVPFHWSAFNFYGGDDSRLYYLFPYEYFKNFTLNIISENMLGALGSYFPQTYIIPFTFVIILIKKLFFFVNAQFFIYGLILSGGFLSFYKLTNLWIKEDNEESFLVRIAGSLMYVLSIFTSYTLWGYQLFPSYLIPLYPLLLFLFITAVERNDYVRLLLCALISGIFSIIIISLPWLMPLFIVSLPLLVSTFFSRKIIFLKMFFLFFVLSLLLNIHWLFHLLITYFASNSQNSTIGMIVAQGTRNDSGHLIRGVSSMNDLLYPMFNLFHKNIQIVYGWPIYSLFKSWFLKFFAFNTVFSLTIILSLLWRSKQDKLIKFSHLALVMGWLLGLYFYTANVGPHGLDIFVYLNKIIPGFVIFRNMYDKFSLAYQFIFSLAFTISAYIIIKKQPLFRFRRLFLSLSILLIVISAKPFISGEMRSFTYGNTKNVYLALNDFNDDYYKLVNYYRAHKSLERTLWLPIPTTVYSFIQDKTSDNHYYMGVSPLQIVSGQSDFAGISSFHPIDIALVNQAMIDKDYEGFGKIIRKYAIDRLVVNRNIPQEILDSNLFLKESISFIDQDFLKELTDKKIGTFGKRYDIFRVKEKYKSQRIYIANTKITLKIKKLSSADYRIQIPPGQLKPNMSLVFLDPINPLWVLENRELGIFVHPQLTQTYAMNFKLPDHNESVLNLRLHFEPADKSWLLYTISLATFIGIVIVLVFLVFINVKKR